MVLTQMIASLSNNRVILCIENNSIGKGIIEPLEYGELDPEIAEAYGVLPEFDYDQFIVGQSISILFIIEGKINGFFSSY